MPDPEILLGSDGTEDLPFAHLSEFTNEESLFTISQVESWHLRRSKPMVLSLIAHVSLQLIVIYFVTMSLGLGLLSLFLAGKLPWMIFVCSAFVAAIAGIPLAVYISLVPFLNSSARKEDAKPLICRKVSSAQLSLKIPKEQLFDVCLEILSSSESIQVQAVDAERFVLRALSLGTWRSPGEVIGVCIQSDSVGSSLVRIFSKSPFSDFDFGKNKKNTDAFLLALKAKTLSLGINAFHD